MMSQNDLELVVGSAIWPGSPQTGRNLDVSNLRSRLINVSFVDSAVNWGLVDISFKELMKCYQSEQYH